MNGPLWVKAGDSQPWPQAQFSQPPVLYLRFFPGMQPGGGVWVLSMVRKHGGGGVGWL